MDRPFILYRGTSDTLCRKAIYDFATLEELEQALPANFYASDSPFFKAWVSLPEAGQTFTYEVVKEGETTPVKTYFFIPNGLLAKSLEGVSWKIEHNGKPILGLGPIALENIEECYIKMPFTYKTSWEFRMLAIHDDFVDRLQDHFDPATQECYTLTGTFRHGTLGTIHDSIPFYALGPLRGQERVAIAIHPELFASIDNGQLIVSEEKLSNLQWLNANTGKATAILGYVSEEFKAQWEAFLKTSDFLEKTSIPACKIMVACEYMTLVNRMMEYWPAKVATINDGFTHRIASTMDCAFQLYTPEEDWYRDLHEWNRLNYKRPKEQKPPEGIPLF